MLATRSRTLPKSGEGASELRQAYPGGSPLDIYIYMYIYIYIHIYAYMNEGVILP